ncbi:MAG: DUF1501 domain-containing protein [Chloroflexota bacterium]
MATNTSDHGHGDCAEYKQRMWQQPISRRSMVAGTLGVAALGTGASHVLLDSHLLDRIGALHAEKAPADNVLVVIQQAGGNDGLNTVVPYTNTQYYKRRPTLAIHPDRVLALDSTVGLHPYLAGIKSIWDEGNLAVVQGVGYPNPDLSHFKSTIVWQTGDPLATQDTGWLGRYLDTALDGDHNPLKAVSIGDSLPLAFRSRANATPAVTSLPDFQLPTNADGRTRLAALRAFAEMNRSALDRNPTLAAIRSSQSTTVQAVGKLQAVPTGYRARVRYPKTDLARQLQLVAQLIHANLGTRVFWVTQDGYDDHAREMGDHAHLLRELDGAITAFYRDMQARNWHRQVMMMTWSEFGRRVEENGDRGTDHGTAAPMFLLGGRIRGNVYGDDPILTNLDGDGNLKYHIDFRSVYGTVMDRWMGANATAVVGGNYERIPFV